MPTYLFQLGREPAISAAEIKAVFSARDKKDFASPVAGWLTLDAPGQIDASALMKRLGGTIKIAERLSGVRTNAEGIAAYLANAEPNRKIVFSLSGDIPRWVALDVKRRLKEQGLSVRYVEPKNTATILHNGLVERKSDLTVLENNAYATAAIQPIEEFSARDFGRPGRDSRSGMLPPKLAKIMINLAGADTDAALLDPFCGSGTILMEAALMGFTHVIGADISETAIADTKKNLAWAQKTISPIAYRLSLKNIHVSDVRNLPKTLAHESIDAIITEPFLGKPLRGNESESTLRKQAVELKNLYQEAFHSFAKILKPGGAVVFIIPSFRSRKEWINTDCREEIERLGFQTVMLGETQPYLRYHRPDQRIARDIWKFIKNELASLLP